MAIPSDGQQAGVTSAALRTRRRCRWLHSYQDITWVDTRRRRQPVPPAAPTRAGTSLPAERGVTHVRPSPNTADRDRTESMAVYRNVGDLRKNRDAPHSGRSAGLIPQSHQARGRVPRAGQAAALAALARPVAATGWPAAPPRVGGRAARAGRPI